jgi:general secretion pathway protein G
MTFVAQAKRRRSTAVVTATGERADLGFTLVELLLVLTIVALLASLAGPAVTGSMQRAREATLKEDLRVMRKALDDHYADLGEYPAQLEELVAKRYIRRVPKDPVTGRVDSWTFTLDDSTDESSGGILDVHSGAEGQARDGSYFKDW